ncbi:Sacchrp_dh_NADP domain-containing protein [Meloidogyne graminicola]|uniref:Sacchrp_dh_NADP domain-containing protein n=1 Tax=Meloidogyne graminicola TaxID=189291 RepID=A0A8S9ZUG5_9BILA|nr:Sacchrp_dh_NADP domain-containing protein [Meloidogyne graminicola]
MTSSDQTDTERYDIVLYGASGFTGHYVLETFAKSQDFGKLSLAIAGRNKKKLEETLANVGKLTEKDLSKIPIIITDSENEDQLALMAKQAKVIVSVVGPYRLYGEAVVKAAVENGASHVDISGEPAWIETMQMKYAEQAKEKGVYIVSACGWDSIPCDMGMEFLKKNFDGTLTYAETFAKINTGKSGYSFNAGTYQTLILGMWKAKDDGLGRIRKAIMPEKLERATWRTPKRPMLWWNDKLKCYCLPFLGADKSIVQRSQYFDAQMNQKYPATLETYLCVKSWFWALALMLWLTIFNFAVKYNWSRNILQKYPDFCSGYMFKEKGPTRQQAEEATFEYWFFGTGWDQSLTPLSFEVQPEKKVVVRCDGPDAGYIATSGCVLACAMTILSDNENMPKPGGVFTSAAAFKKTNIYDRLASFGVVFRTVPELSV